MWSYEGKEFSIEDAPEGAIGFVYCITDLSSGKKYIGEKLLWSTRRLPPLKGKTRKRKKVVESDWKKYYGSSDTVKALLEEHGPENFQREILHFAFNKSELHYLEMYEQVKRNVLLSDDYYNGIINVRINKNGLERLREVLC
jgi:hypothetical protein